MEKSNVITIKKPKSPISEAYRTLRTNIQFSSFDKEVKTIVITSSAPNEGKTTTAVNLAVTLAQSGHNTIIVDCDQRRPSLHRVFNLSNEKGLSNILIGEVSFQEAVKKTELQNLSLLTSGTVPPNPAELLASHKMEKFFDFLKKEYEYIIIDTPPVLMVTDAQILSKYSDGCLLVVASRESDKSGVIRAKELLEQVNAKILGVVLNKYTTSKGNYYNYYHYYHSEEKRKKKFNIFSRIFTRKRKHLNVNQ